MPGARRPVRSRNRRVSRWSLRRKSVDPARHRKPRRRSLVGGVITDEQLRNAPPHGPVLRFVLWLVPYLKPVLRWPVQLLFRNSAGAALGRTYHLRDSGRFQEGWTNAVGAARRLRPKPGSIWSLFWWQLVAAAAQCAEELGGEERATLEQLLSEAPE